MWSHASLGVVLTLKVPIQNGYRPPVELAFRNALFLWLNSMVYVRYDITIVNGGYSWFIVNGGYFMRVEQRY